MTGAEIIAGKAIEVATSEKAQGLLKGLFGKAFEETGEMIADQVRLRRFKNQIKVFEKAKAYLEEKDINPSRVNLKVLAPLIEFSSYEEEEELQDRWAKLIKNILSRPLSVVLQQNSIEILNKISNEEAKILDSIYDKYISERISRAARWNSSTKPLLPPKSPESFTVDNFDFSLRDIGQSLPRLSEDSLEMHISNLVVLGVLKYDVQVNVDAHKANDNPDDTDVNVEVDVTDYDSVRLTRMGVAFIELCKE